MPGVVVKVVNIAVPAGDGIDHIRGQVPGEVGHQLQGRPTFAWGPAAHGEHVDIRGQGTAAGRDNSHIPFGHRRRICSGVRDILAATSESAIEPEKQESIGGVSPTGAVIAFQGN